MHILGNPQLNEIDREKGLYLRDSLKEYPFRTMQRDFATPWQTLAKTRLKRLSEGSQHFTLTAFGSLLKYAHKNGMGVIGAPAEGLAGSKDDIKRVKIRVPYTQEELTRLVAALKAEEKPEMFWIPLLLLHTGARSNEISQ